VDRKALRRKAWAARRREVATSIDRRVEAKFAYLIADLSLHELASLTNFAKVTKNVYLYKYERQEVVEPTAVPWPIVWLLGRHNAKTIFRTKEPSLKDISFSLEQFATKLRWRHALRDSTYKPPFKISKPRVCPPCSALIEGPLNRWLHLFQTEILEAVQRDARVTKSTVRTSLFAPRLVRYALRTLKNAPYVGLENDKDGGFSLLPTAELAASELKILSTEKYEYIDAGTLASFIREGRKEVIKLADAVAKVEEDKQLQAHLLKPLRREDSWITTLQQKVKTHKCSGQVVSRPLHTCNTYALEGLAKWLAEQFKSVLPRYQYLVRNAEDAKARVLQVKLVGHEIMLKVDAKDFFLSGTDTQLCDTILEAFPVTHRKRTAIRDITLFLLRHQFVVPRAPELAPQGGAWRVLRGSGMGLLHSGFLADLAFAIQAEQWITPTIARRWGIALYLRFKDDIFVILNERYEVPFLSQFRVRAKYFKLELEEKSHDSVNFLNLTVYRTGNHLETKWYRKPTSLSLPLEVVSNQPLAVHRTWPRAMVSMVQALCSTADQAQIAVIRLREAFQASLTRMIWPSVTLPSSAKMDRGQVLWVPIPHDIRLRKVLSQALSNFLLARAAETRHTFVECASVTGVYATTVKWAWSNYGVRLSYRARALPGIR